MDLVEASCAVNGVIKHQECYFPKLKKPFFIGVSGGTASGKLTVCKKIVEELSEKDNNNKVYVLSLDSFYKELDENEIVLVNENSYNFDHPRAFDFKLLKNTMIKLLKGESVEIHNYDHKNFKHDTTNSLKLHKPDIVFIEGILSFYQEDIRNLFDLKLFVEADADTRLARRVLRNTKDFDRSMEHILHQYVTYVKPAFEEFCLPTKKYADVIIPRGVDNEVALDMIVQHLKDVMKGKPRLQHDKSFEEKSETSSTKRGFRPH